jgi:hypothetical protein
MNWSTSLKRMAGTFDRVLRAGTAIADEKIGEVWF